MNIRTPLFYLIDYIIQYFDDFIITFGDTSLFSAAASQRDRPHP